MKGHLGACAAAPWKGADARSFPGHSTVLPGQHSLMHMTAVGGERGRD